MICCICFGFKSSNVSSRACNQTLPLCQLSMFDIIESNSCAVCIHIANPTWYLPLLGYLQGLWKNVDAFLWHASVLGSYNSVLDVRSVFKKWFMCKWIYENASKNTMFHLFAKILILLQFDFDSCVFRL